MEHISVFEMIKVGIGPSSSHTMGPWRAADLFITTIQAPTDNLTKLKQLKVYLYGSLAKTGRGHGTDIAILMGLSGEDFTTIDTDLIPAKVDALRSSHKIARPGGQSFAFNLDNDLIFESKQTLPFHPNGMKFQAILNDGSVIEEYYYSIGGGFITTEKAVTDVAQKKAPPQKSDSAQAILDQCKSQSLSLAQFVRRVEETWESTTEVDKRALSLWNEIKQCVYRGVQKEGTLPGGLKVKRRAGELSTKLLRGQRAEGVEEWIKLVKAADHSFENVNKWVTCFALAVNEENAAFGRIVTAPTNGSAGVVPAVMMYANCFTKDFTDKKAIDFILTAGLIAALFKKNATISAAMGGCQAEIGVSSSMAAAALTECLGGSPAHAMMAAEIAMEHHLGMTCDPIGGLVQIPCIERNSMGAIKAITAANLALESDPESAKVSLDGIIKSMWDTAKDMSSKYKETSEGGLAINIPVNISEC